MSVSLFGRTECFAGARPQHAHAAFGDAADARNFAVRESSA
jgi:hypothetical protein